MTEKEMNLKYDELEDSFISKDIGELGKEYEMPLYYNRGDFIRIQTAVNNKIKHPYFKFIRNTDTDNLIRGDICRIRIDIPEYIFNNGDKILTKNEREQLIKILHMKRMWHNGEKSIWYCLIQATKDCNDLIIDSNIPPMPDYSLLPISD